MWYDKDSRRIEQKTWERLFLDISYQVVKQTNLIDCRISTVWIGIDYTLDGKSPLIFETMVCPLNLYLENYRELYATLEEAKSGHEKIVKRYANLNAN